MKNEDEFPYEQFPWKLVYKDGNETKKCYFQSEDHRKKFITRYKLKPKNLKLSCKP